MKKLTSIFLGLLILCLVGCGEKELIYDGNLGIDFGKSGSNSAKFFVYHSNTEDKTWMEIASFDIELKSGKGYDVSLNSEGEKIVISALENTVTKDNNSISYDSKILGFTEIIIEGFEGNITGSKMFNLGNISGQQLYKLYPINNNENDIYFEDLSLDKPYDEDEENLDNILITVEIE